MTQSERMTLEYLENVVTLMITKSSSITEWDNDKIELLVKRLKMVLVARKGGK